MEAFKRKERSVNRRAHSGILLRVVAVLVVCFIAGAAAPAQEPYSPESLLGFIRHLYKNQEYYRAFVELERLEAYWPGYLEPGRMHVVRMSLLMKGKRYDDVLKEKMKEPPFSCADIVFHYDALLHLHAARAAAGMADGSGSGCDDFFSPFLWKRKFVSAAIQGDDKEASRMLSESIFPKELSGEKEKFIGIAEKALQQKADMRDPYVALFAGVVPGLGYYYGGNKPTGVLAFIVISVFSSLAIAAYKTDNAPIGIVLGSAAGFFYGGSILGGYMTAKRYNMQAQKNLFLNAIEDAGLEADRDMIYEKYGLPR